MELRQLRQLMHKAGLDPLRVLSKCSCMNSLIIQCLNTVYRSVDVRCGNLAHRGLGFLGRRADMGLVQEVLQVLHEHAERDCWFSQALLGVKAE